MALSPLLLVAMCSVACFALSCAPKVEVAPPPTAVAPAAPGPVAAPSTASAPETPPTSTASRAPSPFRLVAAGDHSLHALGSRLWVQSPGDGLAFAELRGDALVRDESLARGVARCESGEPWALTATGPADVWVFEDFHPWSACPPPAQLFRRRGDRFKRVSSIDVHWMALAPWTGTSTLVAEVPLRNGPPWGYRLRTLGGGSAPVPRRQGPLPPAEGACWTELDWPVALFASPKGEALVIGTGRCTPPPRDTEAQDEAEEDPMTPAVAERFRPGRRGTIEALPVSIDSDAVVLGSSPHAVWLIGKDKADRTVLVFGGIDAFAIVEPVEASTNLLSLSDGGSLWATQNGELRRRDTQGKWTTVALPEGAGTIVDVHEAAPGDVWLVTDSGLYRTVPMQPYTPAPRECTDPERTRAENVRSHTGGCDREQSSHSFDKKHGEPPWMRPGPRSGSDLFEF